MHPVPGTTPRRPQAPRVAREVWGSGFGVELDLSRQVLWLSLPPQRAGENDDEPLAPCGERTVSGFTSSSALFVKASLFDEGVCAAVELAAQQGAGTFTGKANLLATLIGEAPQIAAAASLGGLPVAVDSDARRVREAFLARSLAKPIGIYTWSDALRRLFHQDRLLQDELAVPTAPALAARLSADPPAGSRRPGRRSACPPASAWNRCYGPPRAAPPAPASSAGGGSRASAAGDFGPGTGSPPGGRPTRPWATS